MSTHRNYCERCASTHESIDCPPVPQQTPGPWKAFKKDGKHVQADQWSTDCEGAARSTHAPIKAGTQVVALVVASSHSWSDLPDIGPNARLIAAAPELLSALIKLRNESSAYHLEAIRISLGATAVECVELRLREAEAVIAKATGN